MSETHTPSEIPLPRNFDFHHPHLPHALPPRLGRAHSNGRDPRLRGIAVRLPRGPRERHHPESRAGGRQEGAAAHPGGEGRCCGEQLGGAGVVIWEGRCGDEG